jgi:hypothetical protein
VASFWGRILDSVPRPAWSSPPEQSGPALTVQVTYEACGQPRTATCVEWSPLLLLKLRSNADHRGLRAGKNSAQFYGEVAHALGIRTGLSGSSAQALFGLCCRAHHELRFVHRVAGAGGQNQARTERPLAVLVGDLMPCCSLISAARKDHQIASLRAVPLFYITTL